MAHQASPKPAFFSTSLDQQELERILRRIDENLALRPLLREADQGAPGGQVPLDLVERLQSLLSMHAPLFVIKGRNLPNLVKWLINLPIRVFGYKQIMFNRELLELLAPMLALLQQVAANQQGLSDWIKLIERKQQLLALDVRAARVVPATDRNDTASRILDPEAFQRRIAAMGDRIRVNLGCGEKPLPDYINVDFREVPEVDVVAEARRLPFDPGTLAELSSAHLVEHFREHELRTQVVPYWKSLLRPDGVLRIICPNWAGMLERLHDGRMSLADFKLVTFGAQDYEGDDHFAMYTLETLSDLLRDCGFTRIEVAASERMNGLCPEMEVLAYL
jgi:predicted SAM-dependent methyltransferase